MTSRDPSDTPQSSPDTPALMGLPEPPPHDDEHAPGDLFDLAELRAAETVAGVPQPIGMRERAERCIREIFTRLGFPALRYVNAQWYRWVETHWALCAEVEIRAQVCKWLSDNRMKTTEGWVFMFGSPEPSVVKRYIETIEGLLFTKAQDRDWLDPETNPPAPLDEIIPCRNALVHWRTGEVFGHTPRWFNLSSLPFAFDSNAECPLWRSTLSMWWDTDAQSADTLQEAMGYTVGNRRELQKFFKVRGPPRSGKGVIATILRALSGSENTTSTSPRSLANNKFSTESFIGKTLALITDARTSGLDDLSALTEELLTITGNDIKAVQRKNMVDWIGILRTNIWTFSNINLKMPDAGNAINSRAVMIEMNRSFLGAEDPYLLRSLLKELPGILNWSIVGLKRVTMRGQFIESETATAVRKVSTEMSNPVLAFIAERCILGKHERVLRGQVYEAWRQWNRDTEGKPGRPDHLMELLLSQPGIATRDTGIGRIYTGIRLREVTDPPNVSAPPESESTPTA